MDEEAEDIEEDDLDCEGELEPCESPPWDDYGEDDIDDNDIDDTTEDTALLRASAAKTEIVITPMSPVSVFFSLFDVTFVIINTFSKYLCACVCVRV